MTTSAGRAGDDGCGSYQRLPEMDVKAGEEAEISIHQDKYLVIKRPGQRGHEYYQIGRFQFKNATGGLKPGLKLGEEETKAVLEMAKTILSKTESAETPHRPLREIKVDVSRSGSATITKIDGEKNQVSTVDSDLGISTDFAAVAKVFERSLKRAPLDLGKVRVNADDHDTPVPLRMTPEAMYAAKDSTPIEHEYVHGNISYGTEAIDEQIRPNTALQSNKSELKRLMEKKLQPMRLADNGIPLDDEQQTELKQIDEMVEKLAPKVLVQGQSTLGHAVTVAQKTLENLRIKQKEVQDLIGQPATSGKDSEGLQNRLDRINRDIKYYEKKLTLIESYRAVNKDWLNSDYWRDVIREVDDYNKAVDNYISAPVNMRYHSYVTPGENPQKVGMMRCGVISDMRNGWVSLADLTKLKNPDDKTALLASKLKVMSKDLKKIFKDDKQAEALLLKLDNALEKGIPAGILVAARELQGLIQKKLGAFENSFNDPENSPELSDIKKYKLPLQSVLVGLDQLMDVFEDPSGLQRAIEDRQRILSDQMLQLVAAQMIRNPGCIQQDKDGKWVFKMAHVGFLDHYKHEFAEGWMHDEAIEMSDMAAIFAAFKGKQIIFNDTGPRIDSETGVIYLPKPPGIPEEALKERVSLNTYFVNIPVQGTGSNNYDGSSMSINTTGFGELTKDFSGSSVGAVVAQSDKALKAGGASGYKIAENLLVAFMDPAGGAKIAVSGGCLSVKDRTGVVCARVVQRFMQKHHKVETEPVRGNYANETRYKDAMKKYNACQDFENRILDPGMPASKVVFKNTGIFSLKVGPHKIIYLGKSLISFLNKIKFVWGIFQNTVLMGLDWLATHGYIFTHNSAPKEISKLRKHKIEQRRLDLARTSSSKGKETSPRSEVGAFNKRVSVVDEVTAPILREYHQSNV
jgi:hypothetical protein